jgi:hypothetical protein
MLAGRHKSSTKTLTCTHDGRTHRKAHATERDLGERGEAGQSHSGESSSIRVGSQRKMSPPMWSLTVGETAVYTYAIDLCRPE